MFHIIFLLLFPLFFLSFFLILLLIPPSFFRSLPGGEGSRASSRGYHRKPVGKPVLSFSYLFTLSFLLFSLNLVLPFTSQ